MSQSHCHRALLVLLVSVATFTAPQSSIAAATKSKVESEIDYAKALAQYDQAIARGNAKPALLYNRAVALYKLNNLAAATAAFQTLLEDPQWAALAHYNLGLIAEQELNISEALRQFQTALARTANERLKVIANSKIAQLSTVAKKASTPSHQQRNLLLVSIGAVADNNATGLAEELSARASDAKDTYFQSLLYGHTYWSNTKIYALLQTRRFQTFQHFDTRVLGAGLERQTQGKVWHWQYGLRALDIQVDDGELTKQFTGHVGGQRQIQNRRLSWRYSLSHFSAAEDYQHLQGNQHQLQFTWQQKWGRFALEPTFSWEHNDRQDKRGNNTFYSYSPQILSWQLQSSWQATAKWQLYGGVEFSHAEYSGNNRLTDIGGINKDQPRTYSRRAFSMGTRYRLQKQWQLKMDYQSLDNDDRFQLYSYDKNTLSVKIDFSY